MNVISEWFMPKKRSSGGLRDRIAKRLREARISLGLSQPELARLSGVSQKTISKIETAVVSAGTDTLEKLARHLNCDPSEFLRED